MFKEIPFDAPIDPKDLIKAEKRFEWMIGFLICQFKFVHQVLGMMVKIPKRGMNTMGVSVTPDGRFQLFYDPLWSNGLTDAELTYIFYHEVLHLVMHHCTKRPLSTDRKDKRLANLAHDLAINELITESTECQKPRDEKGKLAGAWVSELKKQKDFTDIEEKQTSEYYWDYLRKKQKEGKIGGGQCDGDCKNCKLEIGSGDGDGDPMDCKCMDEHGGWQEHEVAAERIKAKVKEIARNNSWGNMSQGTIEAIMAAQIKKINWRNKIRVWFGNHSWGTKMSTRKKPNRRTGFMHPGYKKSYVDKYLVAADTSGSVDDELLGEWIGVLNQLVEYLPIDFMQFDCEKQTDPRPFDRRALKLEFKGRGGTDFQPVMDLVNQRHYRGVMILTDGQAAAPTQPKGAHVLWVLPTGMNPPVDWGERVYLEKHA